MNKVLTISVAAYNLEKLISKNLDSFINSSVRDKIEVIVTNDESTDETANIVEKYVEKYPNIVKLINQKNMGPGSTVNSGIKNATGKYFKMVDGDDWVVSENLPNIIELLEKTEVDMVITNYEIFSNKSKEVIEDVKYELPINKVLKFNEYSTGLNLAMHSTMFKTSIFKDNEIIIDNCFYTDTEYLLLPMKYVDSFMYINLDMYVYLVSQAGQSVSVASMRKNIKMHNLVLNRLIDFYEESKSLLDINVAQYIRKRIAIMASNQLGTYLTYEDYKNMICSIRKFNKALKNKSKEIYKEYKFSKKAMPIIFSNYLLTKSISKMYLKKIDGGRY